MRTYLMLPALLVAVTSIAACSSDGADPRPGQGAGVQTLGDPAIAAPPAFVPHGPVLRLPGPVTARQYRVALAWGQLFPERDTSRVRPPWDIELVVAGGTLDVVATLPGPGGGVPTVVQRSAGHIALGSPMDAGIEGAIVSIWYPGTTPPELFIAEDSSRDGTRLPLETLGDVPGGWVTLSREGKLAWTGFSIAHACPRGFTLGLWGAIDRTGHGPMLGELLTDDGTHLGWMTGEWTRGRFPFPGSFHAEYFALDGKPLASGAGDFGGGSFSGDWEPRGNVGGVIHGLLAGTDHGGGWLGTWSGVCPL